MDFDLEGARAAGATDDQIAAALAERTGFDLKGALDAGATHEQAITAMHERLRPMRALPDGVTPSDAGAGRGSVIPHGPTLRERMFDRNVTTLPGEPAARRGGTRSEGPRPFVGGDAPVVPDDQFSVNGHLYKKPVVSNDVFGPDDGSISRGVDTIAPSPEPSAVGNAFRALDRKPMDQSLAGTVLENVGDAGRGMAKVLPGMATSLWGGIQAGADVVGADKVAGVAREAAGAGRQYLGQLDNPNGDKLVTGALQSLGTAMAGGAAFGVLGAIGTAVGQTAGDKYAELRSQGMDVDASLEGATVHGIAEYVGERIGMPSLGRLVSGLAQKTGLKPSEVLREALKQQGEEQATLAIQDLYDKFGRGSTRHDMTFDDYVNDVVDTAKQTAIMSAVAGAGGRVARTVAPEPQQRPRVDPPALVDQAINETASGFGLSTKAAVALRDKIKGLSPAKAVQVVAKAFEGFERAGMTKKPGAKDGFLTTLQEQVDEAAKADEQPAQDQTGGTPVEGPGASQATPAPAPDAGEDFTGLETAPTVNDVAAHEAATSPHNERPEPTDAQKEAGNYKVGRMRVAGMDISIENPQGSVRRGVGKDGTPWENTMAAHYGYVRGTKAGDGDHSDVFVKAGTPEDYRGPVYVIDQVDPDTGKFDEHKAVIGAASEEDARALYEANYAPGWKGLGAITSLPIDAYKAWVRDGVKRKPLGDIDAAAGNGHAGPVGTEGAGIADRGERDGTGGVVPGEQQQPAGPGPAGAPVPDAGLRPEAALPGPAGRDDALKPGQSVTVDGTPYEVVGGGATAVRLKGEDGKVRIISRTSDNWAKIKQKESTHVDAGTAPGAQATADQAGTPARGAAAPAGDARDAGVPATRTAPAEAAGVTPAPAAPQPSAAATTEGTADETLNASSSEPGAQSGRPGVAAPQPARTGKKKLPKVASAKPVMGSDVLGAIVHHLGGIGTALRGDLSRQEARERTDKKTGKKTQYTAWRGDGMLFRKAAPTDLTDIARVLEEAGYLEPGLTERDYLEATSRVQDIIKAEIDKPGSTQHMGAESIEAEMSRRRENAMHEQAEQAQDALDEFLHSELDMEAAGAAPENRETIAELAQAMEEATLAGVDIDSLKEQFFDDADPEWSQPEYEAHLTQAIRDAAARARGQAQRDAEGRAGGDDQGRGQAGQHQDRPAGDRADGSVQAVRSEGEEARPGLSLQAESEGDAQAKADREAAALAAEQKTRDAEQARLKKQADDREARTRADQTVDDFQLGQSADQQLSGQGDLLSAAPAPAPVVLPSAVQSAIRSALGRLDDARRMLEGVERARGRGHMLALEWQDQQEKIKQGRDKLAEIRSLADKNGARQAVEDYVREQGGEPDLERFNTAQKPAPSPNTIFTEDAAEKARALLRSKLNGGNKQRGGIDPEVFQAGITLAGYHIERGARTFSAYARAMLDDLGEVVRPYLKSWYMAVKYDPRSAGLDGLDGAAAVEQTDVDAISAQEDNPPQENPGVSDPATDLERDRGNAGTADAPVAGDVSPVAGGTVWVDGKPRSQPGEQGSGRARDAGVPAGSPPAGREPGHQPVHRGDGTRQPALFDAGDRDGERGDDPGFPGIQPEAVAAGQVAGTAAGGLDDAAKRTRQRAADSVAVKPGDLENIRATLPYLKPEQQEDVHKAEQRFAKPDGYGMLFTNGTGTGKTFTGLGIVKRFARQGKTNTLIVVPDGKIMADWVDSGRALGLTITPLENTKDSGKGITITTYANLGDNDELARRDWDLVVPDEAHSLMQSADGAQTKALDALRAITWHPRGAEDRFTMLNRTDIDARAALGKQIDANDRIRNLDDTMDAHRDALAAENQTLRAKWGVLNKKLEAIKDAMREEWPAHQGPARPRVAALSATPFAYETTVDWAEGLLFDYAEGYPKEYVNSSRYNTPSPRDYFFIQHFGWHMKNGKLNQPGPKVDRGLMQRQFNAWLKKRAVLSGRQLEVDPDYDRKFILVESAIGNEIDRALEWLSEKSREEDAAERERVKAGAEPSHNGYSFLNSQASEAFYGPLGHLVRRYFLEAIKAKEVIQHVREHLALGRKVVVWHDFKKGGSSNPFDFQPRTAPAPGTDQVDIPAAREAYNKAAAEFRREFPLLTGQQMLTDLISPIERFKREFPDVLLINGDEKQADLLARYKRFNDDAVGPVVALVQSAKNKGWSGHDTTGKHQRVQFNLGLPTQPTMTIQQEGRTYRTGQVSNAMFRYLNTGTNWERWAFASTIAERASATENLGSGELARALKDAFIAGFEESGDFRAGHEGEGTGGKERDRAANNAITEYDRAKSFYFGTQKKNSKTKAQEGNDYYATPEPVGLKMVQWLDLRSGEDALEPSGGHGAIARWFGELTKRTAIEPSNALGARMAMVFDGKIIQGDFEGLHVSNKFDGIAMNPPFNKPGSHGGGLAIEHLAKAATHLRDGGRIAALIPTGPAADKRFDQWFYGEDQRKAQPLGENQSAGKFYVGDIVALHGRTGAYRVEGRHESGNVMLRRSDGNGGIPEGYRSHYIERVLKEGPRMEGFRPAEGLHMVADIKLPQVTFERAGTAVATRIVVLEKPGDGHTAPQQRNLDFSDLKQIGELFDALEDVNMSPRANPRQQQDEQPAPREARADARGEGKQQKAEAKQAGTALAADQGIALVEHTTGKGKLLKGVIRTDLTQAQAKEVDAYTFKKDGGWFIRTEHLPTMLEKFPPAGSGPVLSRAQDVTATPEFARWFKESKVTDEDGAPLVVFHGTNKTEGDDAFTSFDVYSSEYGLFGQGGYFTADPEVAAQYTKKGKGTAPTIYPAYLSIQNPIDMDAKADPVAWEKAYPQADFEEFGPIGDTNEAYYRAVEQALIFDGVEKYEGQEIMQEGLRGMGYDGITHIGGGRVASDGKRHRVFIVFDPEQIKSAIGNRGTFDPTSAAIALKRGTGAGFTLGQAKQVAQQLEALGVRQIHVVESVADMPAERRDAILAKDKNGQARGAYFPTEDEVWVVSSNLRNADDMVFVVLHEAFHRGLQVTFGAEGGKLLRQIYATNQKVRELADQNMRRFGIGREEATNEALADLAGKGEAKNLRGWNRLLKMVRAWLAKVGEALGMQLHFTDAMVESLVAGLTRAGLQASPTVNVAPDEAPALSRGPQHTPEQAAAMAKAGMGGPRTLKGKLQRYYAAAMTTLHDRHALALETRQGLLDQFAGIQNAVQRDVGNLPTEQDPYISARLANGGTSSVMRALMLHGQAMWAANGQHLEKKPGTKGLLDILAPLGEDLNDWFGWMIGNRAARLMAEGRERNLTKDDIQALQSLAMPANLATFKQAAVEYAAFKRSVLDVAEAAGLINPDTRKAWDYADYIPFYRQIDERSTFSPTGRKGLAGQSSGIRTLKGGESALNDPMENLLMNFSRLIDASLKNNALRKTIDTLEDAGSQAVHKVGYDMTPEILPAEQIRKRLEDAGTPQQIIDVIPPEAFEGMAKMWAIQAPSDPEVVRVMVGGKPQFYRVDDPVLLRSLTSFVPFDFPGLGIMRWFKRLLTSTVTAAPDFVARNFIRDSAASQMITRDGFNPGKSFKGIVSSMRETGGFEVMLFAGASFQSGNINAADPTSTGRAMRRALRRKGISGASADQFLASVIDSPVKFWEKYRHFSEAIENANREAVFEAATNAGKSPTAAAFEAKDLMDFSLRGSWAAYQLLADVVPFLNARVQGLYRLGRTDKRRLVAVGLMMTAASLLLAYANGGDDDYEALPDWDKDTYWHFWIKGEHFRLPKPFELGVAFATIPERVMRYAITGHDSGHKLASRVWANLRDQLSFDPVPQMIRPVLNVWANRDTFRDAPIENQSDEGKPPHLRYGSSTSPTMREALDKAAAVHNPFTGHPLLDEAGLSPKRLEYLVNAYTGAAGMYALALGDAAVRRILDEAPQPSMRWDDVPVVKAFYRVDPARSTVWESDLYAMREAADEIYTGVQALKREGALDKAQALEEENLAKLRARTVLDDAGRRLRLLNKRRDMIYGSRTMGKDEKRAQLDEVAKLRAEVARKAVEHPAVREAF